MPRMRAAFAKAEEPLDLSRLHPTNLFGERPGGKVLEALDISYQIAGAFWDPRTPEEHDYSMTEGQTMS